MSIVKVAKEAGVSHATVSRVLNNHPSVSDDTALRVHKAMRRIGYVPSARRRGARRNRKSGLHNGNLGMITDEPSRLSAGVFSEVLGGISDETTKRGLRFLVGYLREGESMPTMIQENAIDGLLILGDITHDIDVSRLKRFPTVWLMSRLGEPEIWGDRVRPNNDAIGRLAADYLLEKKLEQIAFLSTSGHHAVVEHRLRGFRQAMDKAGVEPRLFIADDPSVRFSTAYDEIERLVNRMVDDDADIEGVFVPSDMLVPGLYHALRQRGIEPQRDLHVISCNNEPLLDAIHPRPATIDVQARRVGEVAVEHLLLRLQRPQVDLHVDIEVAPRLVPPPE